MRLIDANALDSWCRTQMNDIQNHRMAPVSWSEAYEEFIYDIGDVTTVDAVKVIRCKDCKHWKLNSCWRVHNQYANWGHNNNAPILHDFKPEDFCSYGERKNNE